MNETKTILIAEDDPVFRKLVSRHLKSNSYSVTETVNGEEALRQINTIKPDLILSDIYMPKLDGIKLVEEVVNNSPEIPIILFSGVGTMSDVIEALRAGAWDYITKPIEKLELLSISINKALERSELLKLKKQQQIYLEKEVQKHHYKLLQQNKKLEQEIELRKTQEMLVTQAKQEWELTIDSLPDMIAIIDKEHKVVRANKTMTDKLGASYNDFLGSNCHICVDRSDMQSDCCPHLLLLDEEQDHHVEIYEERLGGHCEFVMVPYFDPDGTLIGSVHIIRDINDKKKAEKEKEKLNTHLLQSQKLESVGRLASGIAHEINTPVQFLSSNMDFFNDMYKDVVSLVSSIQTTIEEENNGIAATIREQIEEADWEYLTKEFPLAINDSKEGISRITSIVNAMKEFSHPGGKTKKLVDLNRMIETTVTVARNEWKYVASMETDFDKELPKVPCMVDEMGQVILNILVNAAHAIESKLGENPEDKMGVIHIQTRLIDSIADLRISDNGVGMPENMHTRIFDPFYTTKQVGKGTGQGLAIARDVVVDKHDGSINVKSKPGEGTTFIIQLPLKDKERPT